jgi:DNA-binding NarL/FixJ family response regulator
MEARTRPDPAATLAPRDPRGAAIRVVLGGDNLIAREGLARVLRSLDGIDFVGAHDDLASLREAVERMEVDVVLVELRMPPTRTDEGIGLARELRASHPRVAVVVLSEHVEPLSALALFEDGSDGRAYLMPDRLHDREELRRAIHEVATGGSLVDARVVEALLAYWRERTSSPLTRLTPREIETLALVAEGRSNQAVAGALGISARVVERHIAAIFTKLELDGAEEMDRRVQAMLLYLRARGQGAGRPNGAA